MTDPLLSIRDLTIDFGGLRAVDHLSFDLPHGAIVSLIGPNGTGKTTVLNSISGFVRAAGSVSFKGVELLRQSPEKRAPLGIGRTFQNVQLFDDLTLLDNVLAGQHVRIGGSLLLDALGFPVASAEKDARRLALETLRMLDLQTYAERRAGELPLGIRKAAGIARALALRPDLLLLDEPAAGLTRREAADLGNLIEELRNGLALSILLVEHNMRLVMGISDSIVVLAQGRKLMQGTAAVVSATPAVVEAYLGAAPDESVIAEVQNELAERT